MVVELWKGAVLAGFEGWPSFSMVAGKKIGWQGSVAQSSPSTRWDDFPSIDPIKYFNQTASRVVARVSIF
jgi:hypothetical protein